MPTRNQKQQYANDLIISQLGDKEKYQKLVKFIGESFDEIDDVLHYISRINIFEAEKVWLDLIGIIVGLDRKIPIPLEFGYFNFGDYPNAKNMDEGRWYEAGESLTATTSLPDQEYRIALIAQIAKNYGDVSGVGIAYALQNMLGDDAIIRLYRGAVGGNMRIEITGDASSNFITMVNELDIIPRAAGIGYEVLIFPSSPPPPYFGFGEFGANFYLSGFAPDEEPEPEVLTLLTDEVGVALTDETGNIITLE